MFCSGAIDIERLVVERDFRTIDSHIYEVYLYDIFSYV